MPDYLNWLFYSKNKRIKEVNHKQDCLILYTVEALWLSVEKNIKNLLPIIFLYCSKERRKIKFV